MSPQKFDLQFLLSHPAHFIAGGFGSGLSPVAPGTVGTIVAMPCWLLITQSSLLWQLGIVVSAFMLGVYVSERACKKLGTHDHGSIVWDEFVGLWVALVFVPVTWLNLLLGFVLFRFFDIVKPWPIKWLDKKVGGGLGVMIDDVVAGLFAGLCLVAIQAVQLGQV